MRSRFWAVLLAIVVSAFLFRFLPLSHESVDGDEMFSRRIATDPLPVAYQTVRQDINHPPFFYAALRGVVSVFGAGVVAIRSVSLAAGIATVALVALFSMVVPWMRGPCILAALLLALNDEHIYYSQQARSYALYTLLVALLILWTFLLEKRAHEVRFWAAGLVLMTLAVYTHYIGSFYVASLVAAIAISQLPLRTKIQAVAAAALAALFFVPWLIQEMGAYKDRGGLDSGLGWQSLAVLYDLKAVPARYMGIPDLPGGTTLVLCLGLGLAIAGFYSLSKDHPRETLALGVTAIVPPCLYFVIGRKFPVFGDRHLLPSIVPFLMLVCAGVWAAASWTRRSRLTIAVGAAVLVIVQLMPGIQLWGRPHRHPYAEIAGVIAQFGPQYPVFTTWPYGIGQTVGFYLHDQQRISPLPPGADELPDEFAVLYRPGAKTEQLQVGKLLQSGFQPVRSAYYASAVFPEYGTRLSVLRRANR